LQDTANSRPSTPGSIEPASLPGLQSRSTQRGRLLGLFVSARGGEVSLPEILALGIAQFGSRILELRAMGFRIVNRQECRGEQRLSFYKLESGPSAPTLAPTAPDPTDSLFPDFYRNEAHRDDG
jgi:hypothetical protein